MLGAFGDIADIEALMEIGLNWNIKRIKTLLRSEPSDSHEILGTGGVFTKCPQCHCEPAKDYLDRVCDRCKGNGVIYYNYDVRGYRPLRNEEVGAALNAVVVGYLEYMGLDKDLILCSPSCGSDGSDGCSKCRGWGVLRQEYVSDGLSNPVMMIKTRFLKTEEGAKLEEAIDSVFDLDYEDFLERWREEGWRWWEEDIPGHHLDEDNNASATNSDDILQRLDRTTYEALTNNELSPSEVLAAFEKGYRRAMEELKENTT